PLPLTLTSTVPASVTMWLNALPPTTVTPGLIASNWNVFPASVGVRDCPAASVTFLHVPVTPARAICPIVESLEHTVMTTPAEPVRTFCVVCRFDKLDRGTPTST